MQGNPAACRCCLAGTCHGLYRVSRKKWCVGASPFCFFSYLCAVKVHFSCENVGERPEQKPQDVGIECFDFFALREHVPIKQGLRPMSWALGFRLTKLREHVPIKQGLRPPSIQQRQEKTYLREHVPIKQGLRLLYLSYYSLILNLREHVPIKQGLRQFLFPFFLFIYRLSESMFQ